MHNKYILNYECRIEVDMHRKNKLTRKQKFHFKALHNRILKGLQLRKLLLKNVNNLLMTELELADLNRAEEYINNNIIKLLEYLKNGVYRIDGKIFIACGKGLIAMECPPNKIVEPSISIKPIRFKLRFYKDCEYADEIFKTNLY